MSQSKITRNALDLPFSVRWRKELTRAMNNGGWHVLAAGAQHGKTTANAQFVDDHPPVRSTTCSIMPVAQTWAATGRVPLVRTLAESIGGSRLASIPGRDTRIAAIVAKQNTRLIIVNNAHYMSRRQWQELLHFDDVIWGRHKFRPAVVFSGIFDTKELPGLPESPAEQQQIMKRIKSFKLVPGHDQAEVRVALDLLLAHHSPGLRISNHSGHVFDQLTRAEIDVARTHRVATADLVDLVRRMAAAHRANPNTPAIELIDDAFESGQTHRRGIAAARVAA